MMNEKQMAGYYCFLALLGVKEYFEYGEDKEVVENIINLAIERYKEAEKLEDNEYPIGSYVENCYGQPCIVVENSGEDLELFNIVDGSMGGCSIKHCAPLKLSLVEAFNLKDCIEEKTAKENK